MTPNFSPADLARVCVWPPSALWYMAIRDPLDAVTCDFLDRAYSFSSYYKVVSYT